MQAAGTTTTAEGRRQQSTTYTALVFAFDIALLVVHITILALYYDNTTCHQISIWLIINAIRILILTPYGPLKWYADRHNQALINKRVWNNVHLLGFVWWVIGNYQLINEQECRITRPALFWLTFANVLLTYIVFVIPVLVILFVILLCSSRIIARSEAIALAASAAGFAPPTYGLTSNELQTLKTYPYTSPVPLLSNLSSTATQNSPANNVDGAEPAAIAETEDQEAPPVQTSCAICYSDFQEEEVLRELFCTHVFHKECIDGWLVGTGDESKGGHRSCPLCVRLAIDPANEEVKTGEGGENSEGNGLPSRSG